MDHLYWPLSILSKAINYKNLTGASKHVGLSQPQLSRQIKLIEEDLEIVLLDRSSPRHSSWTPEARKLAQIFSNSKRALTLSLNDLVESTEQKQLYIGCLEGLSEIAQDFVTNVIKNTKVSTVMLNIYDLNQLESKFLSTDLDLIFSSRVPGAKKYENIKTIGYQTFNSINSKLKNLKILSPYEFNLIKRPLKSGKLNEKLILSNSLHIRKALALKCEGRVSLPSEVIEGKVPKGAVPVIALGQDSLSKKLWNEL